MPEQVRRRQFAPQRLVEADFARFQFGEMLGGGAVLEELAGHLADGLLFFGEGKVHVRLVPRCSARGPELVQHQLVPARDCFELLVEDLDR